jgi:tetratricopeptide (TPR) repeat protein
MLSTTAAAQLPPSQPVKQESVEEKAKARKELERKALVLLDETLEGAQVLKLAENRAALRVQAGDLLWTRDEKRARALFRDAAADLATMKAGDANRPDRSYWMATQLRSQMLYTVAARDGQLALELLRESRPASEDGSNAASGDPDMELRLEQSLTALAAENDPKAALRLAEESLSKGVTYGVLGLLERLRHKDAEAATKLAGKIVERLRGETLGGSGHEAWMVAASLLRIVLLPPSNELLYFGMPSHPTRPAEKPKPLVMEDSDLRELADMVAAAALKDSAANGAYGMMMTIRPLIPELEKRVPARAAQLRLKLAEMDKVMDPRAKMWSQYDTLMSKPPEAILEEAAKSPAEMREHLYSAAAMKLFKAGEVERARAVVTESMRGQGRDQMLALLEQAEVARAVEKGNTDEARGVVSRIKSKERRASALAELALAYAAKGDRKTAGGLLEEARSLIDRQPDNEREVQALLEVARGYALVEPSKTFEMIDPLIDQANDMMSAAALLEKFGAGGGMFRKGEMVLAPGMGELGGMYARYVKALAELSRVDFDRTRQTADRFNRDEARLMARLIVARSILSDRLDPAAPFPGMVNAGGGFITSH